MTPCDVAFALGFAFRLPPESEMEERLGYKRCPFETRRLMPKDIIEITYVDDNGTIRVRKLRKGDLEYDSPDIPPEAKE